MLQKQGALCSPACHTKRVNKSGTAASCKQAAHRCRSAASNAPQPADGSSAAGSSQPQQPEYPPGYDPNAAAGFMPANPGEKPMWWVEQFEERRRRLAEEQARSSSSSSSSSSTAGDAATGGSSSSSSSSSRSSSPGTWYKALVQLLQLALVNALLILWPASLYPAGLAAKQVWVGYWCYMLFFAGGSVYRLVKFGPLAPRKKDAQGRTGLSTAAWVLFVISIPFVHWPPIGSFLKHKQQLAAAGTRSSNGFLTVYDLLGFTMLACAIGLNWWAAQHLGRAYDRVVAPETLVTDGPYAFVQHPIYASYMLLFMGHNMLFHSAPTALLALAVCLVYYASRTRLESGVLRQRFGQQYEEYSKRTKLFVPFVL